MAVTTTTRLALTRWSAGTDPFSRAQMDSSHAQLEALAAIYGQGTLAARPAAGVVGRFYTVRGDTVANNGRQFYDDGTAWFELAVNGTNVNARAGSAAGVPLTVHGVSGQTAILQEWKNSAGTVVASVGPSGAMTFTGAVQQSGGSTMATLTVTGSSTLQGGVAVSGGASTFSGAVTVTGDLKATKFRSTATRASGLPKTELNDDGTGRMDALIPPGHFMLSLRATVADGWLAMNGQTVSTTTYRDLWEALGSPGGAGATTFVIPDWRDKTAMGASSTKAIGSFGGAADVTLTVNHLPGHTHSIAHTHTMDHTHSIAHTHTAPHTHTINHDHGAATTGSENADHAHYVNVGGGGHEHNYTAQHNSPANAASGGSALFTQRITSTTSGGGGHGHEGWTGGISANHQHAFDVPNYSGSSGSDPATTTTQSTTTSGAASTATTSAASAANSGSTGSGTAFSVLPPYGAGTWVIKT